MLRSAFEIAVAFVDKPLKLFAINLLPGNKLEYINI